MIKEGWRGCTYPREEPPVKPETREEEEAPKDEDIPMPPDGVSGDEMSGEASVCMRNIACSSFFVGLCDPMQGKGQGRG